MTNRQTQDESITPALQLKHALENDDRDGVWQALQADPSLVSPYCYLKHLLHRAVMRDDLPLVSWLLAHGAQVNSRRYWGLTPLECAINDYEGTETQDNILRLLLDAGADMHLMREGAPCMVKETPFGLAVTRGNIHLVRHLVSLGADIERKCRNDYTPLAVAAHKKNYAMIEALCEVGADPNRVIHIPPLLDAQAMRVLIDAGANIMYRDKDGYTPLHMHAFCANTDPEIINTLITAGADVDAPDNNGHTTLYFAAMLDNIDMIRCLLAHGANPNAVGNYLCVLSEAIRHGSDTALLLLLQSGADPDACDCNGTRALHWMYIRLGEMYYTSKWFAGSVDTARLMLARTPRLAIPSPESLSLGEILKVIEADMPAELLDRIKRWKQKGSLTEMFGPIPKTRML